jgi:hypothetical protein
MSRATAGVPADTAVHITSTTATDQAIKLTTLNNSANRLRRGRQVEETRILLDAPADGV